MARMNGKTSGRRVRRDRVAVRWPALAAGCWLAGLCLRAARVRVNRTDARRLVCSVKSRRARERGARGAEEKLRGSIRGDQEPALRFLFLSRVAHGERSERDGGGGPTGSQRGNDAAVAAAPPVSEKAERGRWHWLLGHRMQQRSTRMLGRISRERKRIFFLF